MGKHDKGYNPKHEKTECRHTWGTCDARSTGQRTLPHLCGIGFTGHKDVHRCEACLVQQA